MSSRKEYTMFQKHRICHREGKTRLHNMWTKMIDRTDRPKERNYSRYGGKGITTCAEWKLKGGLGFLNFKTYLLILHPNLYELLDSGWEVDRVDYTGNYSPGNVRMVPPHINDRNKSNNLIVCWENKEITFVEFWERFHLEGISYDLAYGRYGAPGRSTFKTPIKAVRAQKSQCPEDLLIPWEDYFIGPKEFCRRMGYKLGHFNRQRHINNVSTEQYMDRFPPKGVYPGYWDAVSRDIFQPISLEEIKRALDASGYTWTPELREEVITV